MIRDAQKLEETLIWSNYNRQTAESCVSAHASKFVHWVNLIWHKKWEWHKLCQKLCQGRHFIVPIV